MSTLEAQFASLLLWPAVLAAPGLSQEVAAPEPPAVVRLGDVAFQHQLHADDLGIECTACHHETNASALKTPHREYFADFWIDCEICHRPDAAATQPQACSSCHHSSPVDIADETLSSKVVVHRKCWECHESGTGAAASAACPTCHAAANSTPSTSRDAKE